MAVFNNTTDKNGLIQIFERLTRMPDGTVTGTLLKQVTAQINEAFDDLMPLLLSYNDQIRWDDLNHTDAPIGRVNLVASQNDYKITEDDNSLDILNITHVRVLPSSSATRYVELERITADDPRIADILSPASTPTGIPSAFVELGNTLYLDVLPSYSATSGIEIFFGREQSYFASTDTTKEPGIPKPFHKLLPTIAAHEWALVNRTDDTNLIEGLEQKRSKHETKLKNFIDMKHPTRVTMTMRGIRHR